MKTKIQQAGDYSLDVSIEPVEVGDLIRLKFQTFMSTSKFPEDARVQYDVCLSKEEFAVLCRTLNIYAVENC
jgi:hypothetical protein